MSDPVEEALRKKETLDRDREERRSAKLADLDNRVREFASRAQKAIVASVSGLPSLPHVSSPPIRIEHATDGGKQVASVDIEVTAKGEDLTAVLRTTVAWLEGDGLNLGIGHAPPIEVHVSHREGSSSSFSYGVLYEDVSVQGAYSIDPGSMQKKIADAVHQLK